jgi:hypothetical protein
MIIYSWPLTNQLIRGVLSKAESETTGINGDNI